MQRAVLLGAAPFAPCAALKARRRSALARACALPLRASGNSACQDASQGARTAHSRRGALALLLGAGLASSTTAARADDAVSALEPPPLADAVAASSAVEDAAAAASAAQPAPAAAAPSGTVRLLTEEERILLEQNKRIKSLKRAPDDFPAFIRKGAARVALLRAWVSPGRLTKQTLLLLRL